MKKILILGAALLLTACSSAPKRSMQVSTIYSTAYEMIESANACILSGDYDIQGDVASVGLYAPGAAVGPCHLAVGT